MARKYFTLLVRDDASSPWGIDFGDYDEACVKDERDNFCEGSLEVRRIHTKIISTSPKQADINAAVAALNEKAALAVREAETRALVGEWFADKSSS